LARSYFKPDGKLSYDSYVAAIKKGRSYVSEGKSHIIDFLVNGVEAGTNESKVFLKGKQTVNIKARVAAHLAAQQDEKGKSIAQSPLTEQPYWHIERARVGTTQKVRVELIVNGEAVDTTEIIADGAWKDIAFKYAVGKSSWIALRVFPSAHTNPVFVMFDGKPIQEQKSAAWCRQAVDQCWKMKHANIRSEERSAAEAAYNKARKIYDQVIEAASKE
jgi:hypothetical protein